MKSVQKLYAEAIEMQRQGKQPDEIARAIIAAREDFRPGGILVRGHDGTIEIRFEGTSGVIRLVGGECLYEP